MKITQVVDMYGNIHQISITLDNGNELTITATSPDSVHVMNTTKLNLPDEEYGLNITPVDYSTIEITPEG